MRFPCLALLALALACDKPSPPSPSSSTQPSPSPSPSSSTLPSPSPSPSPSTATASPSASASSTATADAAAPAEYTSYTNSRYGFTIDYPTLWSKNPASANDAGQSFSYKSKASMRAWGFANSAHLTPKSLFDDWARRQGVTTKDQDADGWTVAGADRGKQYYSRCIYGADVVVCVEIQYDAEVKEQLAPIAKHVAESLKAKAK